MSRTTFSLFDIGLLASASLYLLDASKPSGTVSFSGLSSSAFIFFYFNQLSCIRGVNKGIKLLVFLTQWLMNTIADCFIGVKYGPNFVYVVYDLCYLIMFLYSLRKGLQYPVARDHVFKYWFLSVGLITTLYQNFVSTNFPISTIIAIIVTNQMFWSDYANWFRNLAFTLYYVVYLGVLIYDYSVTISLLHTSGDISGDDLTLFYNTELISQGFQLVLIMMIWSRFSLEHQFWLKFQVIARSATVIHMNEIELSRRLDELRIFIRNTDSIPKTVEDVTNERHRIQDVMI
jgi:hypothetical protein